MKIGKLPESILNRSVLREMKYSRRVGNSAGIGKDCAVFTFAGEALEEAELFMTTNVVTEDVPQRGSLAVHTAVNNLCAAGAEPVAAETALLFPGQCNEEELKMLVRQMDRACESLSIPMLGGHTEITRAVRTPVITVTAIGRRRKQAKALCMADGEGQIRKPLDVVMTKWTGLAGTSFLAQRKEADLLQRFPADIIEEAKAFDRFFSIVPEAAIAGKSNVLAMHDLSKGGVLGGLWEMAQRFGVGLQIDLKKIPIRQETVEVCNFLDVNPYELLSTGSLLLFCEDGQELTERLWEEDIPAAVIGRTTDGNDRLIQVEEEQRFLTRPGTDELVRYLNGLD